MKKIIFSLLITILSNASLLGCGKPDMEGIIVDVSEQNRIELEDEYKIINHINPFTDIIIQ